MLVHNILIDIPNVSTKNFIDLDIKDILLMDEIIQKKFDEESKNIMELVEELETYKEIERYSPSDFDKNMASVKIEMMRKRIVEIEKNIDYRNYLKKTEKLMTRLSLLQKNQKIAYFGCKAVMKDDDIKEFDNIKNLYFAVAKKYINIKYTTPKENDKCDECQETMIDEDGMFVCPTCGIEETRYQSGNVFYKDLNRINLTPSSTYSSKQNFMAAKTKYQAKNMFNIPKEVYDTVKFQCKRSGYKIADLTKKQIYGILKEKRMGSYYAGIGIIHYNLTGIEPIDLSSYNKQIDEIYEIIEKVSKKFKMGDNSFNVWFKLYKILQLLNISCSKEDLCYSISEKSIEEYEELWKKIVKHLIMTDFDRKLSNGNRLWRIL